MGARHVGPRRERRQRSGGKSDRPDSSSGLIKEGAAAEEAIAQSQRKTTMRRDLARHEGFEEVSPEVGELDEDAFDRSLAESPDEAMALLADLTSATDPKLRELAKRLAGRVMVDLARQGSALQAGVGRIVTQPYRPEAGDLDLDTSLEPIAIARGLGEAPDVDELRVRGWARPGTAIVLCIDRSGSMSGGPLAAAAVAAAAVAWRSPAEHAVVAFASDAVVVKPIDADKAAETVVNDVLALRGHGTTDVALALRAATEQLARSRAARKVVVLLSDCRATVPGDVVGAARGVGELWIVAPEGDSEDAEQLARQTGARLTTLAGPSGVPDAFARLHEG